MPLDGEIAHHTLTLGNPSLVASNSILTMAQRVMDILDREAVLDEKRAKRSFTDADDAEEQALYDERVELSEKIVAMTPTTPTEALIVVMHAIDRISYGVSYDRCQDVIERGERALRRCHTVLGRALAIDLVPLGADHFLPDYMCCPPAPRAAA